MRSRSSDAIRQRTGYWQHAGAAVEDLLTPLVAWCMLGGEAVLYLEVSGVREGCD